MHAREVISTIWYFLSANESFMFFYILLFPIAYSDFQRVILNPQPELDFQAQDNSFFGVILIR